MSLRKRLCPKRVFCYFLTEFNSKIPYIVSLVVKQSETLKSSCLLKMTRFSELQLACLLIKRNNEIRGHAKFNGYLPNLEMISNAKF